MTIDLDPHAEDIAHEQDRRRPLTGLLTRFKGTIVCYGM